MYLQVSYLQILDTCTENELGNFTSPNEMEANGWKLHNITRDEQYCMLNDPDATIECSADDGWYGWGCESSSGTLSTTLRGSGIITIRYGNCWDGGYVNIYLNNTLMDSAISHNYKETSIEYEEGAIVKIKDEGANSVIKLISITFSCKGNNQPLAASKMIYKLAPRPITS